MKKKLSYIAGIILVGISIHPVIDKTIYAPGEWFQYVVYIFGFLTFQLWFLKISPFVKFLPTFILINTMFSSVPLMSIMTWMYTVIGAYMFFLFYSIKNYHTVFRMLQSVLFLILFLHIMKWLGHEPIANFRNTVYYGTVGQHMQSASLTTVFTAILISFHPLNFIIPLIVSFICNSAGAFLSTGLGLIFYSFKKIDRGLFYKISACLVLIFIIWMTVGGKFMQNISMSNSRLLTWIETLRITMERPWIGWGGGTYKILFPIKCNISAFKWTFAHNCWLQIFFEFGLFGVVYALSYAGYLTFNIFRLNRRQIFKHKSTMCLCGLIMIFSNMMYHFPTRMYQAIPLLIFFFAYCQKLIDISKPKEC